MLDPSTAPTKFNVSQLKPEKQDIITWLRRIVAIATFVMISDICSLILEAVHIQLPGSVAGLIVLVIALFVIPMPQIVDFLKPGSDLLLNWLTVLYVPALMVLPLSLGFIKLTDYPKLIAIQFIGVLFVAIISGWSFIWMRRLHVKFWPQGDTEVSNTGDNLEAPPDHEPKYLLLSLPILGLMTLLLVILSVLFSTVSAGRSTIFFSLTMVAVTLFFIFGQWLPLTFPRVPWTHPIITSAVLTVALYALLAVASGESFETLLKESLTDGDINIFKGFKGTIGAGNVYLYMLDAAIVSMALPIFGQKKVMILYGIEMVSVSFIVAFLSIVATVAFARLLQVSTLIGRSVALRTATTPIAIASIGYLGGDPGIAGLLSLTTGIIGAVFWRQLLKVGRFEKSMTRGFVMGAVAEGLGAAICLSEEPPSAPFASVSFVVVAVASSVWIAIPSVRDMLLAISG